MSAGGTTQTITQESDPDLKDRQLQLYADAQNYLNANQWNPYTGQMTAGMSPFSMAAGTQLAQGLLGYNPGFPSVQGGAPYPQAQPFGSTVVQGWGSPSGAGSWGAADDPRYDDTPGDNDIIRRGEFDIPENKDILGGDPALAVMDPVMGPDVINRPAGPLYDPSNVPEGFLPTGSTPDASAAARGLLGYQAPTGAGGMGLYQNPYENAVVNQGVDDILRASQITDQYRNQSGSAGTYGGDRQAIREAEFDRGVNENVSRFVNQARSAGFDTAAGLAQRDADRMLGGAGLNLGAASALNQFGNDAFGRLIGGAGALNQFGLQNQATNQAAIDADMRQWYESQNAGLRDIGTLQGILQGMPVGMNTTQYVPGNRGAGIGGGALTGAGIGSAFGPAGALIGGGLGGLFGAF